MKKIIFLLAFALAFISCEKESCKCLYSTVNDELIVFEQHYKNMIESIKDNPDANPRTFENGELVNVKPQNWTSGFYPGLLWYLYKESGDSLWLKEAKQKTNLLFDQQNNPYTHDLGFMLFCSYGNGLKIDKDSSYIPILIQGAKTLCTRFDSTVGLIRSWDHGSWQYPVIIDNMMNLEYLMWAFKQTGDSSFYNICISHADKTMKNHFREDNSSFHVVSYDTLTGDVLERVTHQGYSDESAWARGQAWGLYGYTMMYRETGLERYLTKAEEIAKFILNNKNTPEDMIPYWDYNAPNIPDAPRDASAAAVMASAFIELSDYVSDSLSNKYLERAIQITRSLATEDYTADLGTNGNFVLKHSTGHLPGNSEIDVPLIYADYYYLETLLRLKDKSKCPK